MKLYIVHGWTYNLDKWQDFLSLLKDAGIEPVMLRVPGLTEPSDEVWTIDGYVAWLDKQLDGVKDPVVLGHSNGGRILMNYNVAHPNNIKHLILLCSDGVWVDWKRVSRKRRIVAGFAKVFKPLGRIRLVRKIVYKILKAQDYDQAPENMKKTLGNMLASDEHLDIQQTTMPTSIIWGRQDLVTPIEKAQKLRDELPNVVSYNVIPDARHAPYYTHPKATAELIATILKEWA